MKFSKKTALFTEMKVSLLCYAMLVVRLPLVAHFLVMAF